MAAILFALAGAVLGMLVLRGGAVTWLAYLAATVFTAADVARCESSHAWADGAAVLQVARNTEVA